MAALADAGTSAAAIHAATTRRRVMDLLTKGLGRSCRSPRVKAALAAILALLLFVPAASADPASYVNPLAGTLGSGFPMVGASVPFGLIQPGPDTGLPDGSQDPVNYCGYAFQDTTIRSFSLTHFDGAGITIAGDVPFMPTTGAPSSDTNENASLFDHASEVAEPGYYAVTLDDYNTRVELTSALRASMARITFPSTAQANLIFDPARSISGTGSGQIESTSDHTIRGWAKSPDNYTVYFAAAFDQPFTRSGNALTFDAAKQQTLTMRA